MPQFDPLRARLARLKKDRFWSMAHLVTQITISTGVGLAHETVRKFCEEPAHEPADRTREVITAFFEKMDGAAGAKKK
jgi:hypothetical protein